MTTTETTTETRATFDGLLEAMSELPSIPLDARERFDAMLRENFVGAVNDTEAE